jgi:arylsulfatase A-like enzyme/Tfp pilus assembly protein PilF
MRKKLLVVLPALVVLAIFVWWKFRLPTAGFGSFKNYNVVLITIDTLRADHLPAYGYTHISTPALDRLAKESLVFEDAFAHVPMTLPSHSSILTGKLPISHGVEDNAGFVLDPKATTLAEILKKNGYETAAFISAFVLDSRFGLNQGFDLYSDSFDLTQGPLDNSEVSRRADATEAEVDTWLRKRGGQKFFLWVHYYDPHDPYDPPEPYHTQYKTAPYDGEIAYTDHVMSKLISDLEKSKSMDRTLVVLTGDHGESLGEHMERTHSLFIYNATLHVPLMIRLPGVKARRINGVVRHIDIAPTILEWLGFVPPAEMEGKSLIPLIQGKEKSGRTSYSESMFPELHYGWSPLKSLTTNEYRFVEAPTPELYDRKTDPNDTKNIYHDRQSIAESLRKQLQQIIQSASTSGSSSRKTPDAETAEKLRALGYTTSSVTPTAESRRIDPKDKMSLLEKLSEAHAQLLASNYQSVVEITSSILNEDPQIVDAHYMQADALLHLKQNDRALDQMLATVQIKPDHLQTLYNLALFYELQANFEESERWYLQLLKYAPDHVSGNLNLAGLYLQSNHPEKAKPYLSRITKTYEDAARTTTSSENRELLLEKLAEIYYKSGQPEQSEKSLKEAIALNPKRPSLHFHLGVIYQEKNQLPEAASEYVAETKVDPKNLRALFNLGVVYHSMNRSQDAAACFRQILSLNPGFKPAEESLAELQKEMR